MYELKYRECNITRWHRRIYPFRFIAVLHARVLKHRMWDDIELKKT